MTEPTMTAMVEAIKDAYREGLHTGPDGGQDFDEDWPDSDAKIAYDTAITALKPGEDALREALSSIKWKSADRDNMEFTARITYSQMDAIRAALKGQP